MSTVQQIVSVSISIADATPKSPTFNTPLIVAKAPFLTGTARQYAANPVGLAAMVADGFATYSRAYQMVSALSAQSGGVASAYVFSRSTQHTQNLRLIPDITKTSVGGQIQFNISYHGVTSAISITVGTNTVDAIIDLIEPAIDASLAGLAGITTTPSGGVATHLDLIPGTAGDFIQVDGFGPELTFKDTGADGSLAAQLATAQALLSDSYYGLLIDSYAESEINLAAAAAEANRKLFIGLSVDDEIATDTTSPTDVATDQLARHRTAVCFTRRPTGDQAAAWMGRMLAVVPGSASWRHKPLAGVTADTFTATEVSVMQGSDLNSGKRAATYTSKRGIALTDTGRAGSGRPFDITHGVDQLQADIETSVLLVFANNPKVPYNSTGLLQIKSAIEGPLLAAQAAGFIEPGWFVSMPALADISAANKANRVLPSVTFHALATGAIESVAIAGQLSLS